MRNQATLGEVGELGLYLTLAVPDSSHSKFWAPSSEITGFTVISLSLSMYGLSKVQGGSEC
jgi:hypothetical protein